MFATNNVVHWWKDGERVFVNVNGATVEVRFIVVERNVVTLRFYGHHVQRLDNQRMTDDQDRTQPTARAAD